MQPPFACAVAFGVLLLFVLVIQDLVLPGWAELAAVMVLVAAFAWWVTPLAAVLIAGLAFLDLDGFLVNDDGQLSWHGYADVGRIVVLLAAALTVVLLRNAQLRRRYLADLRKGIGHG